MQQRVQVLELNTTDLASILILKFRIKANVGLMRVIEELTVDAELCGRPDFLQKQALTPTRMGGDEIRREALVLQLQRSPKTCLTADGLGLEITDPRTDTKRAPPADRIADPCQSLDSVFWMVRATTLCPCWAKAGANHLN